MRKTLADQIRAISSHKMIWRKAFDTIENKIVYVRRHKMQENTRSDRWEVQGSRIPLYSVAGTVPLYITIVE